MKSKCNLMLYIIYTYSFGATRFPSALSRCKSSMPAKKMQDMQAAVQSNPVWMFLYGEQSGSGPVPGTDTRRRLTYELISGIVHTASVCAVCADTERMYGPWWVLRGKVRVGVRL